jgi:hypothetical protein
MSERVQGYCPMGCGQTLFLGSGGYVTCSWAKCPRPTAVADLLEDKETEHLVELGATSFSVQHPMRERLDGELFRCDVHERIAALDGPPREPGTYRVYVPDNGTWAWEATR